MLQHLLLPLALGSTAEQSPCRCHGFGIEEFHFIIWIASDEKVQVKLRFFAPMVTVNQLADPRMLPAVKRGFFRIAQHLMHIGYAHSRQRLLAGQVNMAKITAV